jgi:hypothetical protein
LDTDAGARKTPPAGLLPALLRGRGAPWWIAALTLALQAPFLDRWFSAMDEGHMLHFADLVNRGGLLYRDATIYPLPGSFYLLAGAFRLFEPSILVSRWLVAVEFAGFVALVFVLVRRLTSASWALAAVGLMLLYRVWAFPHWQMFNYSTTALLLLFGSLLLVVSHFESGRLRSLGFAGLLFGLGVYCKQDYGAAGLLAFLVAFAAAARLGPAEMRQPLARSLAWFLAPAAAVGALAGLHFLFQGLLGQVLRFTVLNHFIGLSSYEYSPFPKLLPLFVQDPALRTPVGLHNGFPAIVGTVHGLAVMQSEWFRETSLYDTALKAFIFAPRLYLLAAAGWLWARRGEAGDPSLRPSFLGEFALFAFAAAFMLLAGLYRPQDYVHLAVLYGPLVALAVVQAHALHVAAPRLVVALALILALPFAALSGYSGWLAWQLRSMNSEAIGLARAGVSVPPIEAEMVRDLVGYVQDNTSPEERVAVMPYFAIVNFLAERDAPHGASYIVWPFPEYSDRDERIVRALEARETDLVIWNFTQFPNFPPVWEYAPILYDHLIDRYEIDRVFSYEAFGYNLAALRLRSPPPGRRLIGDSGAPGQVAIERRPGKEQAIEAARAGEYARVERWPFRRVLALQPSAGGRTVLRMPVDVPEEGGLLLSGVGVHPKAWFRHPASPVRFSLEVESQGTRETVYTRILNPHLVLGDRGWFDLEVSLDRWSGREVTLRFSTATDNAQGETRWMGGWSEPRLIVPGRVAPEGDDGAAS